MLEAADLLFTDHPEQVHPPAWQVHVGPMKVAEVFFDPSVSRPFRILWWTERNGSVTTEPHAGRFVDRPAVMRELLARMRAHELTGRFKAFRA